MKYIWFVTVIFLLSCNSDHKSESAIHDEYIASFYKAYVQTKQEISEIVEPRWEIGDTLIIDKDCSLTNYKNDNLSIIKIQAPDTLIILKSLKEVVELSLVSDTSKKGFINKRFIQESIPFFRHNLDKKIDFFDTYKRNKLIFMDSIMIKNNLTEKEFYRILAKENFRRTSRENFIIH